MGRQTATGITILGFSIFCLSVLFSPVRAQEQNQTVSQKLPETVGTIFNVPVPRENYLFVKGVSYVFGNPNGGTFKTEKEREDYIWEQLLLSFEAFRRGITVEEKDIDLEVSKLLEKEKAGFDWKTDSKAYSAWLKDKVGISDQLLRNQIHHLLQVEKLRQQVLDSINPEVTDDEALQEFRNEYNTLSVELAEFKTKDEADNFFAKVTKNSSVWDAEKTKNPKSFKRPGFVSLEFLMNMWKFSYDAVYAMLKLKVNDVYGPSTIYEGYGVFKVLEQRLADEKEFAKLKNSYYDQVRRNKKFSGLDSWLKELKQQAAITVVKQGGST